MKNKKYAILGFLSVATMLTFSLSSSLLATDSMPADAPTIEASRLQSLAKFTKVMSIVEQYNIDELTMEKLIDKALDGMLNNIDAHSTYMNEKSFKDMKVHTDGEFGGLGITVGIKEGALTVIAPIEGTPADLAGMEAGDIILKIDDKSTIDMKIDEAVSLMRGKPKTPIELTIVRKGEVKPLKIDIIRDIIKIDSVYAKTLESDKNILYIRVTNFDKKVVSEVSKAIKKHKNIKGYILDLRNNPGGLLDQAVGLTNLFIKKGVIVSQKGRDESEQKTYSAEASKLLTTKPLVILVNEGSASASEIVSGALQDHKRAILIGEKTFGKGSVQIILPITDIEAIKLTIAKYYLPTGRTIQAVGVTPDIHVAYGKVPLKDEDAFSIKESDLKKHLINELEKVEKEQKSEKAKKDKKIKKKDDKIITTKQMNDDMQLKEAIDVLKALIIIKGSK
ncbi:MAG: S41 family peptidase [Campylobacterota bacterium]|nr:S41 family peptidase [Campylobacterota bacterium]